MRISDALKRKLFKTGPLPEKSFPMGAHSMAAINKTIEQALTSAGLNTRTDLMKNIMDTVQQSMASSGVIMDAAAAFSASPSSNQYSGQFSSQSFTNHAGTRAYKLYVPASYSAQSNAPVPMIVMLHGCTQSPDDFAAGTKMNSLAEQHGFLVVYPAQAANANGSKCWNWFRPEDQNRDRGEPSLIAGIAREVMDNYQVDAHRVFVAGLSAGAAMAIILGTTYPDIFAAVGAHSGLPYAAAHDMPSAFSAMKRSAGLTGMPQRAGPGFPRRAGLHAVPTIVFHGDQDHTVHVQNGAQIIAQAIRAYADEVPLQTTVSQSGAARGRQYTQTVYTDAANQAVIEEWVVHGAGHAWSGGSSNGSFTDTAGPDASVEMIRFFHAQ